MVLWQTFAAGNVLSAMNGLQTSLQREQLAKANFRDAVVVLGYWRSGTTLLHELLCLDTRYTYPTTHAARTRSIFCSRRRRCWPGRRDDEAPDGRDGDSCQLAAGG